MNIEVQKIDPISATITCTIDISSIVAVLAALRPAAAELPKKETIAQKRQRARGIITELVKAREAMPSMAELAEMVGSSRQCLFHQNSPGGQDLADFYSLACNSLQSDRPKVPDRSYIE